jgi:hypothetical protein
MKSPALWGVEELPVAGLVQDSVDFVVRLDPFLPRKETKLKE